MSYKTGTGLVIDMLNSGKRDEHVCSIITRKTAEHSDPEYLKNGNRPLFYNLFYEAKF